MFYGESDHTLDGKFRVFVPKRLQEELTRDEGGHLVCFLTRGQDQCLYLFSEAGFDRALTGLNIGAFAAVDQRAAQRMLFANTSRVELDGSGRVLIPEKVRDHLGVQADDGTLAKGAENVVIVGVSDHAEIWPKSAWAQYHAKHEPILDKVDEFLGLRGGSVPGS